MKQIVILAGGLATRLGSLTKDIPKAMVPVLGKPFLEHQLDLCKKNGVTKIVLNNFKKTILHQGNRFSI